MLLIQLRQVLSSPGGNAVPSGLRGGEWVVLVWTIAAAVDHVASLGQRRLFGEMIVAMKLVDVLGDDDPLGVLPGAMADAIARVDSRLAVDRLRAEVGMPRSIAGSRRLGELLAMPIRAFQAAEVCALADSGAGHEKLI